MANNTNFDDVFTQVAGRLGGIQPLLDTFFGFLCRKTDFYVQFDPKVTKQANMGFPPGIAEKMLLESFKKFPYREIAPQVEEVTSPPSGSSKAIKEDKASATSTKSLRSAGSQKDDTGTSTTFSSAIANVHPSSTVTPPVPPQAKAKAPVVQVTDTGKQVPIGNGGYTENYYWTQTINEVTVYVDVPTGTRGKEVNCVMKPRTLSLAVKGQNSEPLLNGTLEDVVRLDESMWTVASDDNSTQVIITLDKQRKTWWKHVLEGDPEIDTSKVDSQQKMDEYDEQTQATIRKLMFDQKQKRLGLPTSEESLADEVLAKAKNAPGSPFLNPNFEGGNI